MEMDQVPRSPGPPVPPPAAAPYAQKKTSSATVGWIVGGIALVLAFLMIMFLCGTCFFVSIIFRSAGGFTGNGVGLIEITGVLSSDGGGFTGTSSASIVQQLDSARRNSRIKAVLLRIDSPGGTPAAAQEVYREVRRTIEVKPVVVSVGDVCASGAYYIASASSVIFSEPDSDVGSIGVILEIPNVEELDKKIGLHWYVFTQGQYKDIGSPLRPPTPAEQSILTDQMRVAYDHFIRDVALGRHMDEAKVRDLATGLTFPGTQAKDLGLIDAIGNYRDATTRAGRMGGIKGEVRLIPLSQRGLFGLFSEFLTSFKDIANSLKTLMKDNGVTNDTSPPQER
jgi:protease-4